MEPNRSFTLSVKNYLMAHDIGSLNRISTDMVDIRIHTNQSLRLLKQHYNKNQENKHIMQRKRPNTSGEGPRSSATPPS